jgi:serine/threonine protein kinase
MTREQRERARKDRHANTTNRESFEGARDSLLSLGLETFEDVHNARMNSVQMTNILVRNKLTSGDTLINKYLVLEEVGRGAYGGVYLCRNQETSKLYAMKVMTRSAKHGKTLAETIRQEIAVMKKLRHENIVTLHEVIDDPSVHQVRNTLNHTW